MNPQSIINYGGLWLLVLVVFAETGLLVGFFLPGDSLLFTAGALTGTGVLNEYSIVEVLLYVSLAAVLGDSLGYYIGAKGGARLFNRRKEGFFFKREYVTMTEKYFLKYGGFTLIIGRFLPIVRTFAPVLAGVIKMNYRKFLTYNVVGGILWVCTLTPLGYFLGRQFREEIERYHIWIVVFFIVITTIPIVMMVIKESRSRKRNRQAPPDQLDPAPEPDFDFEKLKEKV
jgi:membrane-associated protein